MLRPRFFTLFTTDEKDPDPAFKKAETFQYKIDWSQADFQFKAQCARYPEITCLAATRTQALEGAKHRVARHLSRIQ